MRDQYEDTVAREAFLADLEQFVKSHGVRFIEVPMFLDDNRIRVTFHWVKDK